jgi:hypothetical protein
VDFGQTEAAPGARFGSHVCITREVLGEGVMKLSSRCNEGAMLSAKLFQRCPGIERDSQRGSIMANFLERRLSSLILIPAPACAVGLPSFGHGRDGEVRTEAARVKHVFVIVLENETFSNTFGAGTQDPYLQETLVPWAVCSPSTTVRAK